MSTEIETLRGYVEAARRNHLAYIAVSLPVLQKTIASLERAERLQVELRASFNFYKDDYATWVIDAAGAFPCVASAYPELRAALEPKS